MRTLLPAGLLMAFLPALAAHAADDLVQARDDAAAKAPAGVIFELKLSKATYRMGEVIDMHYAFSSSVADKWLLDMAMYDRSGRLGGETCHIDPAADT